MNVWNLTLQFMRNKTYSGHICIEASDCDLDISHFISIHLIWLIFHTCFPIPILVYACI